MIGAGGMGAEVARLYVAVGADVSEFQRKMTGVDRTTDQVEGKVSGRAGKMGAAFSRATPYAAAFLGALVIGAKGGVSAASDLNESLSKATNTFGKYAKDIPGYTGSVAKSLGISRDRALDMAGGIGAMTQAMGQTQEQSAKLSARVLKLSADMGSFHNVDPTEMLERIQAGLSGEMEPLKRFGVLLSDARVQAEAMRLGLVKTEKNLDDVKAATIKVDLAQSRYTQALGKHGKGSEEAKRAELALMQAHRGLDKALKGRKIPLDENVKLQARMSLLTRDSAVAENDFAETSGGAANQQRILAAQVRDLSAKLAGFLLPAVTSTFRALNGGLAFMQEHSTAFTIAGAAAAGLATSILLIAGYMKIATVATAAWTAALAVNPVVLIIAAIVGLGVALVIAYKKSETFRDIVNSAWDAVKAGAAFLADAGAAVKDFADSAVEGLKDVLSWARGNWRTIATIISGPFAPVVALATDAFGIRSKMIAALTALKSGAATAARAVWDGIKSALQAPLGMLDWLGTQVTQQIRNVIDDVGRAGTAVGRALRDGIKDAITDGFALVYGPVRKIMNAIIATIDKIPFVDISFRMPELKDIPGYAKGGVVRGPTIAQVGEAGPEVIVPVSAGKRAEGMKWLAVAGNMLGGVEGNIPAFANGGAVGISGGMDAFMRAALISRNTPSAWESFGQWAAGGLSSLLGALPQPSFSNPLAQGLATIPYRAAQDAIRGAFRSATDLKVKDIDAARQWAQAQMGKPYVWGGGHAGWDWNLGGYDCSGFASHVAKKAGATLSGPGTTQSTFGWADHNARGPVEWGWRGMGNGPRGEHMGAKVYGTWYQFGNPGHTGGTDGQWNTLGVPSGLPHLSGGGYVMRSGAAVVHRGETVTRAGATTINVTVMPGTGITRDQARMLAREIAPELDRQTVLSR